MIRYVREKDRIDAFNRCPGEFSVYWFDPDGNCNKELSYVDAKTAVNFALDFPNRPAGLMGIIQRVIITDGGDCCVYDWRHGIGQVFPEALADA